MTVGYSENYIPTFEGVGDFLQSSHGTLPELNHYVPLSANGATAAKARAEKKFRQAASEAQTALESASAKLTEASKDSGRPRETPSSNRQGLISRLVEEEHTVRH